MHALAVVCLLLTQAAADAPSDDKPSQKEDGGGAIGEFAERQGDRGKAKARDDDKPPKAYAAKFSGQSYIRVDDSAGIVDLNKDFTIELWVRWERTASETFCGNHAWPSMAATREPRPEDVPGDIKEVTDNCGWSIAGKFDKRRAKISFGAGIEGTKEWLNFDALVPPKAPVWLHFAVCRKDDQASLWLNGQPIGKRTVKGIHILQSPLDVHLGAAQYTSLDWRFDGSIRGFRISNVCRYENPFTPKDNWKNDESTVLLFDFLSHNGEVIMDSSDAKRMGVCYGAKIVERQSALPTNEKQKASKD